MTRRNFLGGASAAASLARLGPLAAASATVPGAALDFPLVDFHAHIDADFALETALRIAAERGAKLGVVEHAGFGELIGDDDQMKSYIARLEGKPVYKGVQAEGLNWMKCFSKDVVTQLDYVLSDALTLPEKDGRHVRIWTSEIHIDDKQDFMERYVDFNVRVISEEPIDIFANPTFLPEAIAQEYDTLWTEARMKRVIDAAVRNRVAIEINSRYSIPSYAFIKMARDAGAKFSFGSNVHNGDVAQLGYCVKAAAACGLTRANMFTPAPAGQKPIQWRKFTAAGA